MSRKIVVLFSGSHIGRRQDNHSVLRVLDTWLGTKIARLVTADMRLLLASGMVQAISNPAHVS
jgi:hypothetical protein